MTREENPLSSLSVQDICISYGHHNVINGLSFEIALGETFGLIGLNGEGKTTLIKAMLGLRECRQGKIEIYGAPAGSTEIKKKLAYLPERFDPPWFLKGMEFIKFSQDLYGRQFDKEKVVALAVRLALDPDVLSNKVQTYSKGMRQKLGIMATLLSGGDLLVLDEPMSGLDPQARALVKDVLQEARSEKRTIFLCSHILMDMNEICDRVAVLSGGNFLFTGPPDELQARGGGGNLERAFLSLLPQSGRQEDIPKSHANII